MSLKINHSKIFNSNLTKTKKVPKKELTMKEFLAEVCGDEDLCFASNSAKIFDVTTKNEVEILSCIKEKFGVNLKKNDLMLDLSDLLSQINGGL